VSYISEGVHRARALGKSAEGAAAWRELLGQTHVDEADYSDWARELADIYANNRRGLSAARIFEYLLSITPALDLYNEHGSGRDRGRVLRLGRRFDEATESYREGGLYAHAALASEEAEDPSGALLLYEQLMRTNESRGERYLAGLAALNAGRMASELGQTDRRTGLLALATRMLEQEADLKEQAGEREAAFRAYLSLIQVGKLEQSYENLAEGYLNCIRILKSKADRFFTMQYYYDFISFSEELGENHTAAELYREAGEYARRVGFIYGDYFLSEAANAWLRVADHGLEMGNPTELIENAYLAAIGCFNRIHDDQRVAAGYDKLTTLPLSEAKVARYRELATDLAEVAEQAGRRDPPPPFPEYFRRRVRMPEIWKRDLLEAESGTDIPDAIGRLVGDHKNVWEVQRRKALLIALAYDDHIQGGGDPERVPPHIIESIGELGHAAAIRPLNALYENGDEATRTIIVERGSMLKQKEAFQLIDKAITESSERLVEAGIAGLRRMTFPQALDSLVRLFNSHEDARVREACLRSIAAIGTDEACEFLLDVLRSNSGSVGARAKNLLEKHAQERMLSALERNRRQEPDPALRLFISRLVDNIRTRRGAMVY
jgi:tetratricopeptide (TPR) repeat protein